MPIGSLVVPFWGLPHRILNTNHKKELLRGLWVGGKVKGRTEPASLEFVVPGSRETSAH